jgi:pimeloyl-ACP methyl ester carboxylesterase
MRCANSTYAKPPSWGTPGARSSASRSRCAHRSWCADWCWWPDFPTRRLDAWLLAGPAVPVIGDLVRFTIAPLFARLVFWPVVRFLFAPRPVSDTFGTQFPVGLALRPLPLRASAEESAFLIPAAARLQSAYPDLKTPAVIVVGEKDRFIEAKQSYRLKDALPRAVLRPVADAGHMVNHAVPERVVDAVDLASNWADWRGSETRFDRAAAAHIGT